MVLFLVWHFMVGYGMKKSEILEAIKTKQGYAFSVIEEKFWIDLLTVTLEQTEGNATKAADILGINRGTFRTRCSLYGIKPYDFKNSMELRQRTSNEKKIEWRKKIIRVMSNTDNIAQAAREIGWNRNTLISRMKIVGLA